MLAHVDRVLLKLPESTYSWTCPWFRWLVWWCCCGLVAAVLAAVQHPAHLAPWIAMGAAVFLLVLTAAQRRDENASCHR